MQKSHNNIIHLIMIKAFNKVGLERNFLRCSYRNSPASITLSDSLKTFPGRSQARRPPFSTAIQSCSTGLSKDIRQEKPKKGQIGKGDIRLSLFAGDMTLCIEKPKDLPKYKNKKNPRNY